MRAVIGLCLFDLSLFFNLASVSFLRETTINVVGYDQF